MICPSCQNEIIDPADACPYCGSVRHLFAAAQQPAKPVNQEAWQDAYDILKDDETEQRHLARQSRLLRILIWFVLAAFILWVIFRIFTRPEFLPDPIPEFSFI